MSPLIDGTAYTFTVTATNPIGSAASAPSAAIVPKGPLPIARIISPANGRHFKLGQFVATSFSCADAGDGPGIAACTDSGSGVLNTSHAGAFTYSVVAVSKDGQATVTQIRYVVLFPSDQLGRPQVRSNRDGSVSFALKLPGPGTVEVLESALRSNLAVAAALKPGRGQFVFARAYERAKRAETIKLRVKPSSAGRKLLRHHRHPVLVRLFDQLHPDAR